MQVQEASSDVLSSQQAVHSLLSQLGLCSSLQFSGDYCRMSESAIWPAQRQYFNHQGLGERPAVSMNCPKVARAYADSIVCYWCDALDAGVAQADERFTILEIGAGQGEFIFHLIQCLLEAQELGDLPAIEWRCLVTDFSQANVEFMRAHPQLRAFQNSGRLVVGWYDIESNGGILLEQETVDQLNNAPVVIANQLMQSLPQDLFFIDKGQLYEGQVSVLCNFHEEYCFNANAPFDGLALKYRWQKIDSASWLERDQQHLLEQTVHVAKHGVVLFPSAATRAIDNIRTLCGEQLLFLCADYGTASEFSVRTATEPHWHVNGNFALPVNFNILEQVAEVGNGLSWSAQVNDDGLIFHGQLYSPVKHYFGGFQSEFIKQFYRCSPDLYLSQLHTGISANINLSESALLAKLADSGFDPQFFIEWYPQIARVIQQLSRHEMVRWRQAIEHVWQNYFLTTVLQQDHVFLNTVMISALDLKHWSLAKQLGDMLLELGLEDSTSLYHLGLACLQMGQWQSAADLAQLARDNCTDTDYFRDINQLQDTSLTHLASYQQIPTLDKINSIEKSLVMVPFSLALAEQLWLLLQDPIVAKNLGVEEFLSIQSVEAWLLDLKANQYFKTLAIVYKDYGVVGAITLVQKEDIALFAYTLGCTDRGTNLNDECLQMILEFAKEENISALICQDTGLDLSRDTLLQDHGFKPVDNNLCDVGDTHSNLVECEYSQEETELIEKKYYRFIVQPTTEDKIKLWLERYGTLLDSSIGKTPTANNS